MRIISFFARHRVLTGWVAFMVVLALLLLFAPSNKQAGEDDELDILCTFGPIYAVAEGVARDVPRIKLSCLVQRQDICLRSYQLSDWDLYSMAGGHDLILGGGRGLESFESQIAALADYGVYSAFALYNLDLIQGDGDEESHFSGDNPHLYLSVAGLRQLSRSMAAILENLDPDYAETYAHNQARMDLILSGIENALPDLAGESAAILNEAALYPARDLGIATACIYPRESGEDVTGEALEELLSTIESSGASVVLMERQAPTALADALEDAGYRVVLIDVLSNYTGDFTGMTEILKDNLARIASAYAAEEK